MRGSYRLISVFIIGLVIASVHVYRTQSKPFYYQTYFEPAVMVACGKGFTAAEQQTPKLTEFLNEKIQSFDCRDLPENQKLTRAFPARAWFYMMYTVGGLWKVTGIHWNAINYLVVFLYALSICFAYLLFRSIAGPWASASAAILFGMSSLQREYLSFFRDYSKTPFLIAGLFLLSLTLRKTFSWKHKILVAIGAGVVVGVGYGFRTDLLVLVPFSILVFLFFQTEHLRKSWLKRLILSAVFLLTFVVVALPIFRSNINMGACTWHFPLSGFADQFAEQLGLSRSLYSWMFEANDRSTAFLVLSYGERMHRIPHIIMCSAVYDQISKEIVLEFIQAFPADFYRRFLSSIPTVLKTRNISDLNVQLVFLAFVLMWFVSKRISLFFLFVVVYFCGHAFFQLQQRHYFYLEFILWWSIASIISLASIYFRQFRSRSWKMEFNSNSVKSLVGVLVSLTLIVFGIRAIVDFIQGRNLMEWTAKLENSPRERLVLPQEEKGDGLIVDLKPFPHERKLDGLSSELAVIEFQSDKCKEQSFKFRVNYNNDSPDFDLSREIPIQLLAGEKSRRFYLPLNFHANSYIDILSRPISLVFSPASKDCFQGVYRVTDRTSVPLWIDFSVPNNVQPKDLKQKFQHWYFE